MQKKLIAAGVVGLLGAWLGVALLLRTFDAAAAERVRKLAELGEKVAPLPTDELRPLAEACAGKVPEVGLRGIAGYVAKVDPAQLPALPATYMHADQVVVGLSEGARLALDDRYLPDLGVSSFGVQLQYALDPSGWSRRLRSAKAGRPELGEVRVLVAARYASLQLPRRVDAEHFEWGRGEYGARVVEVPSGKVLCEGRGQVHRKQEVTASGSGKTKADAQADASERLDTMLVFNFLMAAKASPVQEVCTAGGRALCELTAEWTAR